MPGISLQRFAANHVLQKRVKIKDGFLGGSAASERNSGFKPDWLRRLATLRVFASRQRRLCYVISASKITLNVLEDLDKTDQESFLAVLTF